MLNFNEIQNPLDDFIEESLEERIEYSPEQFLERLLDIFQEFIREINKLSRRIHISEETSAEF